VFVASLRAEVGLGAPFQDHMVLQRGKPLNIWGSAAPGEVVTVTFADSHARTQAGATGRWQLQLPAQKASAEGRPLTAEGENRLELHDVLVGEVWLCAGQSNMEFGLSHIAGAEAVIESAQYPLIRQLKVPRRVSDEPLDVTAGTWQVCSPETAGTFSAVGYYFARQVQAQTGVPVGILNVTHGGTRVEGWTRAETLAAHPEFAFVAEEWQETLARYPAAQAAYEKRLAQWQARKAVGQDASAKPRPPLGPGHHYTPSGLYNGMLHPVIPMTLRGILWYQGESNSRRAAPYEAQLVAMVEDWRQAFGQGDLPFYAVQLPGYVRAPENPVEQEGWVAIRAAQAHIATLPQAGLACAIDLGEHHNIHPTHKRRVGERLARLALHRQYGVPLQDTGPQLRSVVRKQGQLRLRFADVGAGLVAIGNVASGFELAGVDGIFHPADAAVQISGNCVVVTSERVPEPVSVRYAWQPWQEGYLYNASMLPAPPFRWVEE